MRTITATVAADTMNSAHRDHLICLYGILPNTQYAAEVIDSH